MTTHRTTTMQLSRRSLLKGLAAAAAFAGDRRLANADEQQQQRRLLSPDPVSILVLDFAGGWNIHASFAARTSPSVNRHGIYTGADLGPVMRVSNLPFRDRETFVRRDSASWGMRIPGFEDRAREYSVIGSMRHAHSYTLDDHIPSAVFAGTGYLDRLDAPGIGTVIARGASASGPAATLAPPAVVIGPGYMSQEMARASGPWLPYAPVMISPTALPVANNGERDLRWSGTEMAIDERARAARLGHSHALAAKKIETMRRYKEALRRYRGFFIDKAIHTTIGAQGNERLTQGLLGSESPTTQQLIDAVGGTTEGDEASLALAFRCLEGGSRFVSVSLGFWLYSYGHDTHQNEDAGAPLYPRAGQILAGVSWLLEKLGLAKKVLVVAYSEMARSCYRDTCYNEGGGTDHGPTGLETPKKMYGSNRQSVLLAHGPIVPGREVYAADPEYGDPIGAPCITAELLAFLAECSGVAREDHPWSTSPDGAALDADTLARGLLAS